MTDLRHAAPALIEQYSDAMRKEAQQLQKDEAVIALEYVDGQLDAEVMLDDKPVHVRWRWNDEAWESESDSEDEALHNLGACAALFSLIANDVPPEAAAPHEPLVTETFQMKLERLLERPLKPEEEGYVAKVEKRFERVQRSKEIFDQDMVRLHPRWKIEGTDPLELWSSAPESAVDFWNYVALALSEKKLPYPMFLKAVTDLDATRSKLASWKQDKSVPQWIERIRMFTSRRQLPSAFQPINDVRLVVTTSEAKLQARDSATQHWAAVSADHLNALRLDHQRGALVLAAEAELLLVACLLHVGHSEVESFRLEIDRHTMWLNTLFHQPGLNSRLVTLDDASFARSEAALEWQASDVSPKNTYLLKLVLPGTKSLPSPMRVLGGTQPLYLSGETIYRGPEWFGDTTLVEAQIEVPAAAIASSDGVAFLAKLGAELPESLAERVKVETMSMQVSAQCAKPANSPGTNYTHIRITATSPEGHRREVLAGTAWKTEVDQPRFDGSIVSYDRSELPDPQQLIEGLRATYDAADSTFRVRMTRNFPEFFFGWKETLPAEIPFAADEQLQCILADPLIARVRLEATQTNNIDWFDLRVVFDIEGLDLKPSDIRKLLSSNGGFVKLADGTWRRVKIELNDEQQEMVDSLGIDLNDLNEESHRLHWRHLTGSKAAALLGEQAWMELQGRMTDAELSQRPSVPAELQLTLRPYQVDGYHFLSYLATNRFGGILADDMGLGKTVQTITWVLWLRARSEGRPAPVLVVCPKSVLDVWAAEFLKAAPAMTVQVLHDKDELDITTVRSRLDVLVINYAQLRSTIESLKTVTFLAAILDEGQQIKNPDSKAAISARELVASHRLVLTGTPMENRLLDLWSLMAFATPGALGDRGYFTKHFDRRRDERASRRLSARLRPFVLRRTKGQVAKDLPPRTEENMLCEMSGAQEQMYRDELARAQNMVLTASSKDLLQKRRFALLQALTRLRQICCHPGLTDETLMPEESAKLTAALELIEQLHEGGHKVLFFSQFVSMLKIVRTKLGEMNVPHHWLTGSSDNRADIVKNFQADEAASVFLISLKAGGSGLNLTAASYVILYDPWWNPAVESQAIDRAHRIGQTQPVTAYRLVSRDTIEEKILTLQQKKQILAGNVLGEESFAQNLTKEDFEFLLGIEMEAAAEESAKKKRARKKKGALIDADDV